jgi:TctA family transporter
MNNIFYISAVISFIFTIAKFIEMKYIEKDVKPLKLLLRDALLVYFSVIIGYFVIEQFNPIINNSENKVTPIFTGNPEF